MLAIQLKYIVEDAKFKLFASDYLNWITIIKVKSSTITTVNIKVIIILYMSFKIGYYNSIIVKKNL